MVEATAVKKLDSATTPIIIKTSLAITLHITLINVTLHISLLLTVISKVVCKLNQFKVMSLKEMSPKLNVKSITITNKVFINKVIISIDVMSFIDMDWRVEYFIDLAILRV
jgi:hypothetical protein